MTPLHKRDKYSDNGRLLYTYRENTEEYGFIHVYLYKDGTYFPLTNEDGSVIEGNVCICNAHSSSECVCVGCGMNDDFIGVVNYTNFQDMIFYCEFTNGGWDNVDPVYKLVETIDEIIVYGGCMQPGNDDYHFNKKDLRMWKVEPI